MVPFVRDENTRIVSTLSHAKWRNVGSRSQPNGALFWGNDLESTLVVKNDFQRYIICLCLESFVKSHIFWNSLWIVTLIFTSFCRHSQPGLKIEIQDHPRIHFNATNLMAVLELTNKLLLKITFFEVSPIISVCVNFGTILYEYGLIMNLNHCFDWWAKIWHSWTILPIGLEMWNLSSEVTLKAQRALLDSYKRYEFKYSIFLWVSVINWYLFNFIEKCEIWKSDFYKTKNLILKCFLNNWNFIKIISKPVFAN